MDTLAVIIEMLTGRFGVPAVEVAPDATFADLDLDSLALVEFLLVVQQELGVTVAEDEVSPDDTIASVVELVDSKKTPV